MRDDRGVRKVARVQSELGESPVWDARTGLLYFVDISQGKINVLRQEGRVETVHQSTARIGALGLTESGNLIFTEDACIALFDVASGEVYRRATALQDQVGFRFNDGGCDPQGRFVTGLMDMGSNRRPGALYRYDSALNAQVVHDGVTLPNGLAWSEDGRTLFFVDSVACSIFRAAYSAEGVLEDVTLFVKTAGNLGRPDGIALDREGGLWVCQFNGACLLRYDRNGRLTERVTVPVPRPTSCCFGGDDLGTLFITTARFAMTPAELDACPDAGDLYALRPEVGGMACHVFKESS